MTRKLTLVFETDNEGTEKLLKGVALTVLEHDGCRKVKVYSENCSEVEK